MSLPINKPAFITLTEVNEGTCIIPVRHIGAIVKSKAGGSTIVCEGEKYDFTETPEQIFAMLEPKQVYMLPEPGDVKAEREEQKKFLAYWMSEIREAIRNLNDRHQF